MQLGQRIKAFSKLGEFLGQFGDQTPQKKDHHELNELYYDKMTEVLQLANAHNGWFTSEHLRFSLKCWSESLKEANINKWVSNYTIENTSKKRVAIIMAGNIPLVGFHDFLSVILSGHHVLIKLSSNDTILLPFIVKLLIVIDPNFEELITFTDEKLTNFDAVIATGSNNTARYFEYYFDKYPNIIRKNRNSIAVLTGNETSDQLELLANDIFRYFGMGCRNVSKIYIPSDYNFDTFFNAMYSWKQVIYQNKYMNNYDYNKAVYLMSNIELLDNEFMLLKEDEGISSPISIMYYEKYDSLSEIHKKVSELKEQIQCIVSQAGIPDEIPFGTAQCPYLWDYADGIDTMDFLLKLHG